MWQTEKAGHEVVAKHPESDNMDRRDSSLPEQYR